MQTASEAVLIVFVSQDSCKAALWLCLMLMIKLQWVRMKPLICLKECQCPVLSHMTLNPLSCTSFDMWEKLMDWFYWPFIHYIHSNMFALSLFLYYFPYMVAGSFSPFFYQLFAPVSYAPLSIFGQSFLFLSTLFPLCILLLCQLHIMEKLSAGENISNIAQNFSNIFSLGAYYKIITSFL